MWLESGKWAKEGGGWRASCVGGATGVGAVLSPEAEVEHSGSMAFLLRLWNLEEFVFIVF